MASTNCYSCTYLSKRSGAGNYFIFTCKYWGIITKKILPQQAVIESIGKKCPFYNIIKRSIINKAVNKDNQNNNKKDKNGLDILI